MTYASVEFQFKCGSCKWWAEQHPDSAPALHAPGKCRRNAPIAMAMIATTRYDYADPIWPDVKAAEWCGEYKQRW